MSGWDVYWFTRLDAFRTLFVLALCVLAGGALVSVFLWGMAADLGESERAKRARFVATKYAIAFIILAVIGSFIPSSKEVAAIYLIPKIANNENVQQIPDKAMQLLKGKLDHWMEEMAGKDKK